MRSKQVIKSTITRKKSDAHLPSLFLFICQIVVIGISCCCCRSNIATSIVVVWTIRGNIAMIWNGRWHWRQQWLRWWYWWWRWYYWTLGCDQWLHLTECTHRMMLWLMLQSFIFRHRQTAAAVGTADIVARLWWSGGGGRKAMRVWEQTRIRRRRRGGDKRQ